MMTIKECQLDINDIRREFNQDLKKANVFAESAYRDYKIQFNKAELGLMNESVEYDEYAKTVEEAAQLFEEKSAAVRGFVGNKLTNFMDKVGLKISKLTTDINYKFNIKKLRSIIAKDPEVGNRLVSVPSYVDSKKIMDTAIANLEKYINETRKSLHINPTELQSTMANCKNAVKRSKEARKHVDMKLKDLVKMFEGDLNLSSFAEYGKDKEKAYKKISESLTPNQSQSLDNDVNKGFNSILNVYAKMIQTRAYLEWEEVAGAYAALKSAGSFKDKMNARKKEKIEKSKIKDEQKFMI